jgi:hypothetical protein
MLVSKFMKAHAFPEFPRGRQFRRVGTLKGAGLRAVENSSLRVPGVVPVDAFRQQTFAAALAPARKGRATAFGTHPGAETVLTFACSLGWLISAFHKTGNSPSPIGERLH